MKLLLKLLGVNDYIEELENNCNNALESISQLHKDKDVLAKELEEAFSSLNELLSTKSILTAKVLKLREQVETLKQSNSEYLAVNEDLAEEVSKLTNFKDYISDAVTDLVKIVNTDYDQLLKK